MAGTYINNGDGTSTIAFDYTADTTKVLDTLYDAGKFLYSIGFRAPTTPVVNDYNELTNSQKLDIIDHHIKTDIKNKARAAYVNGEVDTYTATVETQADGRHI